MTVVHSHPHSLSSSPSWLPRLEPKEPMENSAVASQNECFARRLLTASSGFLAGVFSHCCALSQTSVQAHRAQGSDPCSSQQLHVEGLTLLSLCCCTCEANALKSALDIPLLFKLRANNLDSERKTEAHYLLFSGRRWWLEKALWATGISV